MFDVATWIENVRLEKNPITFCYESKTNEDLSLTYSRTKADSADLVLKDKASGKTQKMAFKRESFTCVESAYALEKKGSDTMLSEWIGLLADFYFEQKITPRELKAKTYDFQNNVFEAEQHTYTIGKSGHFGDKRWKHYELLFKNNKPTLMVSEMDSNRNSFREKPLVICLNRKFYELSDWEEAQISSFEVQGHPKKQIAIIEKILEDKKRTKQLEGSQIRNMMHSKTR